MTNILALDTATDACSAALMIDGAVYERYEVAPRKHTDLILPMIKTLFAEAGIGAHELDAIVFGAGPGSFTGVRIATSVAQGIALAHDIPVLPVSCLALLAAGGARLSERRTVVPIMDARKQQIYSAVYTFDSHGAIAHCIEADWIGEPEQLKLPATLDYVICGIGSEVYREAILARCTDTARLMPAPLYPHALDAFPIAAATLAAGDALAPELARPIYLRAAL